MDSQITNYWQYQHDGKTTEAEKCKQNAIETSMNSSVPCVFTSTVAYETNDSPSKKSERKRQKGSGEPVLNFTT